MKHLITVLMLLPLVAFGQAKYYLAAAGNDNASGTTAATAWKTIGKLNTATYAPGDSVFFMAGDTFRGAITVHQSGSPAGRIVFTSYGAGARAVISGAMQLPTWTQHGDTFETQVPLAVRNFFAGGQEQELARFPNAHQYLWLDSARTNYLLDNDLLAIAPNKVSGSRVCVHTAQWAWEKSVVQGFVLDTLKFQTNFTLSALDGYGYFLYDNLTHLDTVGEWKYVNGSQRLWYMPPTGQHPNNLDCEASVYNFGIQLDNDMCYVSIENLAFERQGSHGVFFPNGGSRYNVVNNCVFHHQLNHGVQDQGKYNEIANSAFEGIGGIAIYVNTTGGNCSIHHNTFHKIGMHPNYGIGGQINLSAIKLAFVDSCIVHHNDIDSVGYCGISADGAYHMVERNVVHHAMLWNNDGAGLHAFGIGSHHSTFQNNFVTESDGSLEGTNNGDFITPAIYFDFEVHDMLVKENSIYNHKERGIFQNSGNVNNSILDNVVYGSLYGLDLNGSPAIQTPQTGFVVKHNTFFALTNLSYCIRQIDYTNTFNTGIIDSNYYFQPYNANQYALRMVGMAPTPYSFAAWQATGNDLHTQSSFVSWATNQNNARLFINASDTGLYRLLDDSLYLDLDSVLYCGAVYLAPYTSKILINTMTLCNPVAAQQPELNRFIVYPNPTTGDFVLRVEADWIGAQYRLLNALGQPIVSGQIAATDQSFDLRMAARGMYLLELTGPSREVVRVIKQ